MGKELSEGDHILQTVRAEEGAAKNRMLEAERKWAEATAAYRALEELKYRVEGQLEKRRKASGAAAVAGGE